MTSHARTTLLRPAARRMTGVVASVTVLFTTWQDRRRARQALARLDDHLLRDVGLDPLSAAHEIARPFWRD